MAPEFTKEQDDAARYRQLDACVVAGPGSGKTTVLVERYRRLIEEAGFDPQEILAITFTEKAAANMKSRLIEKFRHRDDGRRQIEQGWVSTIHGFCARLLRENAIAAGIDPRFRVLDARESEELQFDCMTEALDELTAQRRAEMLGTIAALNQPGAAGGLCDVWDAMRAAGMSVAAVRAIPAPLRATTIFAAAEEMDAILQARVLSPKTTTKQLERFADCAQWVEAVRSAKDAEPADLLAICASLNLNFSGGARDETSMRIKAFRDERLLEVRAGLIDASTAPHRALLFDALDRFEEIYGARKNTAAALDFNDLERHAIALLRGNAEVKTKVRRQFRQVMLDEFQDINEQQEKLVSEVRGENAFFAVGDINQSIYGFRHAEPAIFAAYRDEVVREGRHYTELMANFRSRPEILRFVEALLNGAKGIDERSLTAGAGFCGKSGPSIEVIRACAAGDEDSDDAGVREAKWIAYRLQELRATLWITGKDGEKRRPEYRDFAVLCRSREGMKPVLDAFQAAGIPNVCGRRQSFLESRTGLDIVSLLEAVENPRDSAALAAVLRSPLVGVSDEGLLRLRGLDKELKSGSITTGLNFAAFDNARLSEFDAEDARRIVGFIAALRRWRAEQPVIALDLLIVRMLNDCGFTWIPGTAEGDDVESFLALARGRGVNRTSAEFLREIESMVKTPNTESDLSDDDQGNRVQVMTAHAAKGLEYAVTMLASMSKGVQRTSDPMNFTPSHGLGIKWGKEKEGTYDSWGEANKSRIAEREEQEVNRLLYVAMTRAEEHLVLSYAFAKSSRGRGEWARRIDEFFGLKDLACSPEFRTMERDGFAVRVLSTDVDPPARAVEMRAEAEREGVAQLVPLMHFEQAETAVNATALNVFAHCPRKYYIGRYVGWSGGRFPRFDAEGIAPDADEDDASAADLGTAVHDLLAGKAGEYSLDATALADVFLRSEPGALVAAASRVEREWEFIVEVDGALVRGSIDLWFEDADGIHIVDYKTDTLTAEQADARAAYYAPQLSLYSLAIEKAFGCRPVSASLHFLRLNEVREVTRCDAGEIIQQLRAAQEALRFEVHPGEHCRSCEYFQVNCPAA